MMNSTFPMTVITGALTRAVDAALRYDPGTRHRLARLEGKILQISSTTPPATLFVCPSTEGVRFLDTTESVPNTILRGNLPNLLGLLGKEGNTLANTEVEVVGDVSLLKEIRDIFHDIDIDWEEPLSAIFGIVPGHQLAELLRSTFSWANTARTKTVQYFSEYLTEELRMIPSEPELKNFYSNVDNLRSDTERLEARIKALASSLKSEQE